MEERGLGGRWSQSVRRSEERCTRVWVWKQRPWLSILMHRIHCSDGFLHCQGAFQKHSTTWVFAMPCRLGASDSSMHCLVIPHTAEAPYAIRAFGRQTFATPYKKPSESPLINLCGRKQPESSLDADLNCSGGSRGTTPGFSYKSLAFQTWWIWVLENSLGVTSNPSPLARRQGCVLFF